jgi:high affinity sulfate transporter 1
MMPEQDRATPRGRIARLLPILDWAPRYDRAWLRADLIAGLTVAALVVPKSLGYAGIANVPIEHGLYAAAAGAILYALFGTSRQIATNPSSGLAAVAGSAVILAGVSADQDAVALVSGIALIVGALFLVMTVFKMGWISQFISRAVIVGFLCGAALDVTVGELQKITGTDASGDNAWQEFWSWVTGLGDLHRTTLLVGVLSLVALFGLRVVAPRLPGTLLVVVGGLLASVLFDLGAHGVALVGDVPRGLPSLVIPDLDLIIDHAGYVGIAAVAIVMIGFSQSAGDARAFATKHRYRVDIDQESLAQGAANIGAGLFQGIPVSTSLSASSLNDTSGAKSQLASLVTGGVVILTMLAFAPVFSDLPTPVLGAVIIDAVIMGMIDVPELRRMFRVKRTDFWIAVAAILGVILSGVLAGIVIGVILSVGWLVHTVTSPAMPVLGRERGTRVFREIEEHPGDEQFPGVLVLSLGGGLFFATADALGDRFRELAITAARPPTAVVLDCRSVNFIDSQGSAQLHELVDLARTNGISLRLARVKPHVLEVLTRDGVVENLGADNIHVGMNEAVETQLSLVPRTPA